MVMKRSKSWGMNLQWLRDKENKNTHREKGSMNGGDYSTKYHPEIHHTNQRSINFTDKVHMLSKSIASVQSKYDHEVMNLKGCVSLIGNQILSSNKSLKD